MLFAQNIAVSKVCDSETTNTLSNRQISDYKSSSNKTNYQTVVTW